MRFNSYRKASVWSTYSCYGGNRATSGSSCRSRSNRRSVLAVMWYLLYMLILLRRFRLRSWSGSVTVRRRWRFLFLLFTCCLFIFVFLNGLLSRCWRCFYRRLFRKFFHYLWSFGFRIGVGKLYVWKEDITLPLNVTDAQILQKA